MFDLFVNFIDLFTESAPWLLLGLLIAGLMKWLVPLDLLKRHMGKNTIGAIIKAAFIGAPLPLCSCGVIPAAIGLRRAGASKSASVSFLVATPETGVDSISVSYALLGPFIAIVRPISAILSAIYAGLMVKLITQSDAKETQLAQESNDSAACCASKAPVVETKTCCEARPSTPEQISFSQRILNSLSFASGKLLEDITRWLLIGLALAAAIKTWVPSDFLTQWGDGFAAMLVMALIGIPMYICATASTPIAAGFLAVGVSPGAVLVFMLAGPATNLSTMGMIRQEMGKSVLVAYLVSILSASILLGYATNWAISQFGFEVKNVAAHSHEMSDAIGHQIAAVALALLMVRNLVGKKFPRLVAAN